MHKNGIRIIGAVAAVAAIAVTAAAMTATEAIKGRHHEMEMVYQEMKTFAAIAKNEQPFDAEVVQSSAERMAEHLARAAELFPEGSLEGDAKTLAKPEIWTDREQFDELMASTQQAIVEMQSVTEAAAFGPALGKIGSGCKNCHKLYRLPKD